MGQVSQTEFLSGTKRASASLGAVLLLGLGVSGEAVRDYCVPLVGGRIAHFDILLTDEDSIQFSSYTSAGLSTSALGSFDELPTYDICIASPGIAPHTALFVAGQTHSSEIISEVEFAWRESAATATWVAITGTNGKTTTTALCAHLLQQAGLRAAAVGNIGDACITAVASGAVDVYVAEVSSYQLAHTCFFAPDVALLLNITPDHLAWHETLEAYVEAKLRIFANMCAYAQNYAVLDATSDLVRGFVKQLRDEGRCVYVPVGTAEGIVGDMRQRCGSANAAFMRDDGMLVVALDDSEYELLNCDQLRIVGPHNYSNALMAASAALCLQVSPEDIRTALASFEALEHRLEPCGQVGGITCYNDSKATNVDATLTALHAFAGKRPVVLLGGDDKGTELDELARVVEETCSAAVCFGAAGPRFAAALDATSIKYCLVTTLAEALDAALELAAPDGLVLLSPACASFDEFDNFEHRGRVFKDLVAKRRG